jgi:acyl-CoA reductase-like NAD-dependent aldehyde dehydrogenase
MPDEQSVEDMVDEVLARQAAYRASQTGESFEDALETVIETVAGRQLQELRSGPHSQTKADEWQTTVASERAEVLREARRRLAEHLAPSLRWR